jgi:putative hydrolase of HD superfamily
MKIGPFYPHVFSIWYDIEMLTLEDLESFMRLLHAAQHVTRVARIPNETEQRNTAEHTFELTLLAWYIVSSEKLDLDHSKVIRYALSHDLIEAYSGDTYAFDAESQKTKAARENAAVLRIESEFPEFSELTDYIHAYEAREDKESKFVYALDKLIDPLNASMETRQSIWKDLNVSYDQFFSYKDAKIQNSPDIHLFWEALCKKLNDKKDFFFYE